MDSNTYLRDSSRTVSTQYHQELVTANEIDFMLQAVLAAGAWADRVKRGLFYGSAFTPRTGGGSTTSSVHKPELADLLHAVLGCVTESAEMAEHLLDVLRGKKVLDTVNVVEEIGDIEWYVALALRFTGAQDHGDAWTRNIAKLRARFPDKFAEAAAVTRDLVAERAVLEGGGTSLPTALVEIEWAAPEEGAERIRDPGSTATERHEAIMNVVGTEWVDSHAPAERKRDGENWDPQP